MDECNRLLLPIPDDNCNNKRKKKLPMEASSCTSAKASTTTSTAFILEGHNNQMRSPVVCPQQTRKTILLEDQRLTKIAVCDLL